MNLKLYFFYFFNCKIQKLLIYLIICLYGKLFTKITKSPKLINLFKLSKKQLIVTAFSFQIKFQIEIKEKTLDKPPPPIPWKSFQPQKSQPQKCKFCSTLLYDFRFELSDSKTTFLYDFEALKIHHSQRIIKNK